MRYTAPFYKSLHDVPHTSMLPPTLVHAHRFRFHYLVKATTPMFVHSLQTCLEFLMLLIVRNPLDFVSYTLVLTTCKRSVSDEDFRSMYTMKFIHVKSPKVAPSQLPCLTLYRLM